MSKGKHTSPHVASLQRQLREARQTQPEGIRRLVVSFPAFARLVKTLHEVLELSDSRRSKVIGAGGHGVGQEDGKDDGTEVRGGWVSLRGGMDTERYRRMEDWIDAEIGREVRAFQRAIRDAAPDPVRVPKGTAEKRRCRRDKCPKAGRRQYGYSDGDGVVRCESCHEPMPATKGAGS